MLRKGGFTESGVPPPSVEKNKIRMRWICAGVGINKFR